MRDRLIELIHNSQYEYDGQKAWYEQCADHLLENGVIVPPAMAGQTVYRIVKEYNGETRVIEGEVFEVTATHAYGQKLEYRFYFWAKGEEFIRRNYSLWCDFTEVGKTVFPTKEEAQAALKERERE